MGDEGLAAVELHRIKHNLPELSVKAQEKQNAYVCDIASAYYNANYSLGFIIGPILGGALKHHFGFRSTCDIMAAIAVFNCGLYFIMITLANCFRSKNKSD